jgi:hypothetical protein
VKEELDRMWKEAVLPNLRCYTGICLEVLRRTRKTSIRIASLREMDEVFNQKLNEDNYIWIYEL